MSQSPVLTYRRSATSQPTVGRRGKALEIPPNQSTSASFGARRQARGGAFAWGWLTALLPRPDRDAVPAPDVDPVHSGNKIPETGQ